MRAMILAAGRGERMQSLTANTPKALLRVGNRYLIEYALYALANQAIQDIVINVCYCGDQIKRALGRGEKYGVTIHYSEEADALETGGGIYQALPLLGSDPFIVMSCDVITDFALQQLPYSPQGLAHLVLVDNPPYHLTGDFCLSHEKISYGKESTLTFANIGVYRPELFSDCKPGKFRLASVLEKAILQEKVTGQHYRGIWYNVGTPEELHQAIHQFK